LKIINNTGGQPPFLLTNNYIMKTKNRVETRILKAMFSYKNIIVASAWGLTAYASMYAWMYLIMFIFEL
tara:strand:- start:91 stop:297 length:207 start_codon:yes stop_codon:yes gene_type:complete